MHVLINGLLLSPRPSGIGQYILHLVEAMAGQLQPQEHLTLLVPEDLSPQAVPVPRGASVEVRQVPVPSSHPVRRIAWEQLALPRVATELRADVLFSPAYALPVRLSVPSVVTVHDLAFLRYSDVHPRANRVYLTWITRASVKKADRVIAVSNSTKCELEKLLSIPPEKIEVVYNGVSPRFRPVPPDQAIKVTQKYSLPDKYILYVGNVEPRKNLPVLLRAFDRIKKTANIPHQLVILGQRAWLNGSIDATWRALQAKDEVRFTGYVPGEDVPALYSAADVFVYPSMYEGFGLPILEAMACGTPVITSNVSSMPEVAGEAAELVDPTSVDSLSEALTRLLANGRRRHELVGRGLRRAATFSWSKAGEATLQILRTVACRSQAAVPASHPLL